jgi:type III secretory pathway lipoprotein EscJ
MLKPLDQWELAQVQIMTNQFARSLKTRKPKTDDESANQVGLTFSGEVNFSDTGNKPKDFADFAEHQKAAKAETALFEIKRLTLAHSVKDSIKKFLLQRNSVTAANRAKKAEREKQKKDSFVSHPSWF